MSNGPELHTFFVDNNQYSTTEDALKGIEIKTNAGVPADYQLYLEEEGEAPDRLISDNEPVKIAGYNRHFIAVPPATFGQ